MQLVLTLKRILIPQEVLGRGKFHQKHCILSEEEEKEEFEVGACVPPQYEVVDCIVKSYINSGELYNLLAFPGAQQYAHQTHQSA